MRQEMVGTALASAGPNATICTSLQADNHTNTSSLNFTGRLLCLTANQQSTEGYLAYKNILLILT